MIKRRRPAPLDSRPTVSVVVPCYNYGHYLEVCIASVLEQTRVDVDVLIVDDASPDGSADVARAIAARDSRVRVLVHERNRGHIETYNDGLEQATGDFVLLLSADDLLAPGALARSCAVFERHPRVGLVYGPSPYFRDVPPPPRVFAPRWTIWPGASWIGALCRRSMNPVSTTSALMRREALAAIGGYDVRLPHSADLLLWLQIAAAWDVAHIEGVTLSYYRQHASNMHATAYAGTIADARERLKTFDTFFDEDGKSLPLAQQYRQRVNHALREEISEALAGARREGAGAGIIEGLVALDAELSPARQDVPARVNRVPRPIRRNGSLGKRVSWHLWQRFGMYP